MRTRKMVEGEIVWFGSAGKNEDGTAKKTENFSNEQQGVVDSLTQKLSVIRKELWYNVNYGLPLFEKLNSKLLTDTEIIKIISSHPDVVKIDKFTSTLTNHQYKADIKVISTFGEISLSI